jgi:AcrR family transcriptional regulator
MPRVSEEHLTARREQILDAAIERFSHNGFHATGMADIIAASGLSAGAVYRYFRSKDELIEAVVQRVLGVAAETFDRLLADGRSPDPADAVAEVVAMASRFASQGRVDVTRVAVQAWGEALRNEQVAGIAAGAYRTIRGYFTEVARRAQQTGRLPADADPEVVSQVLFSQVLGFILQRLLLGDVDPQAYGDAVRALLTPPRP